MNKPCSLDMTSFKGRKRLDIAIRGDNRIQGVQEARGPSVCVLYGTHMVFHKCAQCGLESFSKYLKTFCKDSVGPRTNPKEPTITIDHRVQIIPKRVMKRKGGFGHPGKPGNMLERR